MIVAGLLGGMCALYFTGLALTDAAYRAEFHEQYRSRRSRPALRVWIG